MNSSLVSEAEIDRAVYALGKGRLVAFPTESWYGLAADPFNDQALDRLYAAKKRPADKPILVLVESIDQLGLLAEHIPGPYPLLMNTFWPGPLSLVFPAKAGLPERLTAGTGTVAVRCSSNSVAVALVGRFGRPITGTSANISGDRPHRTAAGVVSSMKSRVDVVLDGGATPGKKGSTIVVWKKGHLACIREGQIPFSQVSAAVEFENPI